MQLLRISILVIFLLFIGCQQNTNLEAVSETEEKHYQRAQRLLREGREDEALNAFLKVVEKRNDAAESHLEAGQLYSSHIGDPVAAIYHYRKFLELKPDSEQSERVIQLIDTSKKDFARQLPGQPYRNDIDRLDLLEMLEKAREQNKALNADLAETKRRLSRYESVQIQSPSSQRTSSNPQPQRAPSPSSQATTPDDGAEMRIHTVQQGDTLTSISSQYFGTPRRYLDIFEANRNVMASPNALRIGQQLKIPVE